MTTLFLITFYQTLTENLLTIIPTIYYNFSGDVVTYSSLSATPNVFIFPSSSYFFTFLSCLILSYKRIIDLNYKITSGIIVGIILFFGFSFNFINSMSFITFYTLNDIEIIEKSNNYMALYNVINIIITLSSIFLVVYLSIKKGKKESLINKNKIFSYILNLGKTTLFFIGFMFVLGLLYSFAKFDIKIINVLGGIAILAILIYYLYLNYQKSKSYRFLFYFNLSILIIYLVSLVGCFFLSKIPVNFIILKIYFSILSIINMLFFISNLSFISVKTSKNDSYT